MIAHKREIIRLEMSEQDARGLIDILNNGVHPEFQYMNQTPYSDPRNQPTAEQQQKIDRQKLHRINLVQNLINTLGDALK